MKKQIAVCLLALAALPAWASLNVFATVPEWGALAKEIGGEQVTVYTATTAFQDPHRIEARPSLLAQARERNCSSPRAPIWKLAGYRWWCVIPEIQPFRPVDRGISRRRATSIVSMCRRYSTALTVTCMRPAIRIRIWTRAMC
jgi:hypothetical protein